MTDSRHADDAYTANYWSGAGGENWLRNEARYDRMLASFSDDLLDAAHLGAPARVLDVGCGTGPTSRAAARRVSEGAVVGVDLSEPLIDHARWAAADEGLSNVHFEVADAAEHPWAADFDAVVSRFGVMFFADPVAAFTRLSGALHPGGRLAFVCWQQPQANQWVPLVTETLEGFGAPPPFDPTAPGPFSFADRDRVTSILTTAGLTEVTCTGIERLLPMGDTVDHAVEFLCAMGIGRVLLADVSPADLVKAKARLGEAVARYAQPDGVFLRSASWLVTARRGH